MLTTVGSIRIQGKTWKHKIQGGSGCASLIESRSTPRKLICKTTTKPSSKLSGRRAPKWRTSACWGNRSEGVNEVLIFQITHEKPWIWWGYWCKGFIFRKLIKKTSILCIRSRCIDIFNVTEGGACGRSSNSGNNKATIRLVDGVDEINATVKAKYTTMFVDNAVCCFWE